MEKENSKPAIDPVGMIMLVFVGLLLQESTSGLLNVWERISSFGYERTLLVIAILFYWMNILRICLGFARSLDEGKSAYMMGMSTFMAGISSLVLAYLSVALVTALDPPMSGLGWNRELVWSCFYLIPNVSYLIWDLVLIGRRRRGENNVDEEKSLFVWMALDGVFIFGLVVMFAMFHLQVDGFLMVAMVLTAFIVTIDFSYNRLFYFGRYTQDYASTKADTHEDN